MRLTLAEARAHGFQTSSRRLQERAATVLGMTTSPNTPTPRRFPGWRIALLGAGAAILAGGALHPDADAKDSLREELAVMTADSLWVPGHALLVIGIVLLADGLWTARRRQVWPQAADRALLVTTVALVLYAVETVVHLAAALDSHALHHGDAAPIAFTHVGLGAVIYPISGLAVVYLSITLAKFQRGIRRAVVLIGVPAGLAHTVSVPLTLLFPDAELSPVFAAAGVLLAVWAIALAGTGAPARNTAATWEFAPVA
jgi:hypothetical protein